MREHPIVVTVHRPVHDIGKDLLARLDALPQELEDRARHARMPDQAVRLLERVAKLKMRDVQEHAVRIGDASLQVRLRNDDIARIERPLVPRKGGWIAHGRNFPGKISGP